MTGLVFFQKNDVGDLGILGRYKDKPTPYGSGMLLVPGREQDPYGARLEELLILLEQHIATIKACGAETIVVQVDVNHKEQCNLEFSPAEMVRLGRLGVHLAMSCYTKG